MQGSPDYAGSLKRVLAVLAFVALAMRVAIPSGFMIDQTGGLTICNGHGPAVMAMHGHGGKPEPAKQKQEHVCPFAGNAAPTLTGSTPGLPAPASIAFAIAADTPFDLAPGRGLAAPPPPSQAPPTILI